MGSDADALRNALRNQSGAFLTLELRLKDVMNSPSVLISILNWNGGTETQECLSSLFKMEYKNFKVLVIDNASTDDSLVRIESTFPKVMVVRNSSNLGFAGGQNFGIQYAIDNSFDYVWVLNNDTTVRNDTLSLLMNRLHENEQIAAVSPLIAQARNGDELQFCGSYINWQQRVISLFHSIEESLMFQNGSPDLICLWGTALLLRTSALRKVGLFDEKFFAYHEDMDLSVRIVAAGFRNEIVATTRVFHALNHASMKSLHYVYYMVRNDYFFWSKHLTGRPRRKAQRECIARSLAIAAGWRDKGDMPRMHASLIALVHAIKGSGGVWVPNDRLPNWLVKILMLRPYLVSCLLLGRYADIVTEIEKRIIGKIRARERLNK